MRRFLTWRRIWATLAAVALLFAAFEVGVRLLPPDAVSYTIETINPTGPDTKVSGTITDPKEATRTLNWITSRPNRSLISEYQQQWQGIGCSMGTYSIEYYSFTWHGLLIAVISPGPGCPGRLQRSSGGIPDWFTYLSPEDF